MKAALLQLNVGDDPEANLPRTVAMVQQASDMGAEFVLTPEVTNCVSLDRAHQRNVLRHEADDPTLAALRDVAAARGIHLLIGSLALKTDDADGRCGMVNAPRADREREDENVGLERARASRTAPTISPRTKAGSRNRTSDLAGWTLTSTSSAGQSR